MMILQPPLKSWKNVNRESLIKKKQAKMVAFSKQNIYKYFTKAVTVI